MRLPGAAFLISVTVQCARADLRKRSLPRLPQHESLYPIGLKSARIEIPHIHILSVKEIVAL
jgi:hypothetical protein